MWEKMQPLIIIFSKLFIYVSLINFQIVLSNNEFKTTWQRILRSQGETRPRNRYCMELDGNTKTKDVEQKKSEGTKSSVHPILPKILVDDTVQSDALPVLSTTFYQLSLSIKSQSCPFLLNELTDKCIDLSTYL